MLRRTMAVGAALAIGLGLAALPATQATGQEPPGRWSHWAGQPRGLTFGPNGTLYVAEAGVGGTTPCFPIRSESSASAPPPVPSPR